ncbi:DUF732 domain-containing protein [Mycobacteroides abscessus]|uniref:DUF732 domain-containing protein n=1 Tax=Mycobacteroides abscessus TaxID=36809 RepID=UPI0009A74FDE|nr:DUF732 domain-containing protein [Mycobacteroides abscessus]MDO3334055.1 DUF732 domain-containing protein [Mycobacteroides abscessus subsp. bolletii]SLI70710.1 Protein of uncharacterised function (DUF732) [Mycobacteroides abscessus subsp. abscessus]
MNIFKVVTAVGFLLVGCSTPAMAAPTKEEQVKAAFRDAGITTRDDPAMVAFAVCMQRKAATHDDVVESLLGDLTKDQAETVVSIAEDIWCPTTELK